MPKPLRICAVELRFSVASSDLRERKIDFVVDLCALRMAVDGLHLPVELNKKIEFGWPNTKPNISQADALLSTNARSCECVIVSFFGLYTIREYA